MNIFMLDEDISKCARDHTYKHLIKMILEYSQLLSTAHRILDGKLEVIVKNGRSKKVYSLPNGELNDTLYTATHVNHPSAIWARQNDKNYKWLCELALELCNVYENYAKRTHKCKAVLTLCMDNVPKNISITEAKTKLLLAMPDQYKNEDPVKAYRDYYKNEKTHLFDWRHSQKPTWI